MAKALSEVARLLKKHTTSARVSFVAEYLTSMRSWPEIVSGLTALSRSCCIKNGHDWGIRIKHTNRRETLRAYVTSESIARMQYFSDQARERTINFQCESTWKDNRSCRLKKSLLSSRVSLSLSLSGIGSAATHQNAVFKTRKRWERFQYYRKP